MVLRQNGRLAGHTRLVMDKHLGENDPLTNRFSFPVDCWLLIVSFIVITKIRRHKRVYKVYFRASPFLISAKSVHKTIEDFTNGRKWHIRSK